jgi:hypothetical protein
MAAPNTVDIKDILPIDGGFDPVIDGVIDVYGNSGGGFGDFGLDSSLFGGDLGGLNGATGDFGEDVVETPTAANDPNNPNNMPKAQMTKKQYDAYVKEWSDAQRAIDNRNDITTAEGDVLKREVTEAVLNTAGIPYDGDTFDYKTLTDQATGGGLLNSRIDIIEGDSASASASGAIASILGSIGSVMSGGSIDSSSSNTVDDASNSSSNSPAAPTGANGGVTDNSAASGDSVLGTDASPVVDPLESWEYNAADDVFTSNSTGESIPANGSQNVPLDDGGTYTILTNSTGTSGTAEHTVVNEAGQAVGKAVDTGTGIAIVPIGGFLDNPILSASGTTDGLADIVVNTTSDVNTPVKTTTDNTGDKGDTGNTDNTDNTGDKGDKGDTGNDGLDGLDGGDGLDGNDGLDGGDGLDGNDGLDGGDGLDGNDGLDGGDGLDGSDGLDGGDGLDGNDGLDGGNGLDGGDGTDGTDGTDGGDGTDGSDGAQGIAGVSPSITQTLFGADLAKLTPITGDITAAKRFAPRRRRTTLFGDLV